MSRCLHALKQRQRAEARVIADRIEAMRVEMLEHQREWAARDVEHAVLTAQIQAATQLAYSPWYLMGAR